MAIAAAVMVAGAVMQSRAQSKANRANAAQQREALAFQEKHIGLGIERLEKGNKFAFKNILANQQKAQGDMTASLASRGIQEGSTMSLAANRGVSLDTSRLASENERQLAIQIAALHTGKEFPMIQHQGPTGNWGGDFAGAYLASQRYGSQAPTTAAAAAYSAPTHWQGMPGGNANLGGGTA